MKKVIAVGLFLNAAFLAVIAFNDTHIAQGGIIGPPRATLNGDVNGDGTRDIADPVFMLNWLFSGGPGPVAIECPPNRLPATGASECYDTLGNVIDCDNEDWPGQDGFYQSGCPVEGRFVNNGDGTVTDNCTGLMWRETPAPGTYTWQQALQYCENLEWEGHEDWRLPNWLELHSLAPYLGSPFEPGIYWSSSSWVTNRNVGLTMEFDVGVISTGGDFKTRFHRVGAVRTIQPGE